MTRTGYIFLASLVLAGIVGGFLTGVAIWCLSGIVLFFVLLFSILALLAHLDGNSEFGTPVFVAWIWFMCVEVAMWLVHVAATHGGFLR